MWVEVLRRVLLPPINQKNQTLCGSTGGLIGSPLPATAATLTQELLIIPHGPLHLAPWPALLHKKQKKTRPAAEEEDAAAEGGQGGEGGESCSGGGAGGEWVSGVGRWRVRVCPSLELLGLCRAAHAAGDVC